MSKQAMLILELGEHVPITWERFKQEFNGWFFLHERKGVNVYTKLVHQASIAEWSVNYESADEARKKWYATAPTFLAKRQAIASSSGSAIKRTCPQSNSSSRPTCTTCGKSHFGEYRSATGGCFQCGKTGHRANNCSITTAQRQGTQGARFRCRQRCTSSALLTHTRKY